ncbi:MAG: response regulator [Niastella sp.]|nr:response regulator [Niastella sp.]
MTPKRILLAEDDVDDRDMFSIFLSSRADIELAGFAENGVEVIELLGNISESGKLPDMIVLDQNMPKQNGLQTLEMLKESNSYQHIPVFVYSTYADSNMEARSIQAGALAVFSKPYSFEGYHEMMNSMLKLVMDK